jgi:hypothetical protein
MTHDAEHGAIVVEPFAAIKDLTGGREIVDTAATFARLGELLASSGLRATLQVHLLDQADRHDEADPHKSSFTVKLVDKKATTGTRALSKADVELITTPETWLEIARGELPPHEAFFSGRMRVRGNVGLAQDMLKHIADSPGRTHHCHGAG